MGSLLDGPGDIGEQLRAIGQWIDIVHIWAAPEDAYTDNELDDLINQKLQEFRNLSDKEFAELFSVIVGFYIIAQAGLMGYKDACGPLHALEKQIIQMAN